MIFDEGIVPVQRYLKIIDKPILTLNVVWYRPGMNTIGNGSKITLLKINPNNLFRCWNYHSFYRQKDGCSERGTEIRKETGTEIPTKNVHIHGTTVFPSGRPTNLKEGCVHRRR